MKKDKKKDIKYLNLCLNKALYDEFDAFCKTYGMSKVGAVEQALRVYMDKMRQAMEFVKK